MPLDRKSLSLTLTETEARWKALDKGSVKEHPLGYSPGPDEHSLTTREMIAHTSHKQFLALAGAPMAYPPGFDWRAAPARPAWPAGNYVTPIRDQKTCGSCVSFGSVAALESAVLIKNRAPGRNVDLSEAFLFYCHKGVPGGTCSTGWYVSAAVTSLQGTGTVDERCYPYTPVQQPCKPCPDWAKRLTKIKAWRSITSTAAMKDWLANRGPLITCFTVYQDFDAYRTGVYHHVTGARRGGHCVCCVGYSDTQRAWICKNSWGPTWGERGFFRIAYGDCGIDSTMWAIELA